jgi:hypothetical protein
MKQFQASAVERRITAQPGEDFFSEPMEAGWAREAIFFLWIEEIGTGSFSVNVQLSPDGINWIDDGAGIVIDSAGYYFLRASHFGNWLRIRAGLSKINESVKLSVQLHLKD